MLGAAKPVANGRALVRLAITDPIMTEVEVSCKGKQHIVGVGRLAGSEVCGIKVRLLELKVSSARLEITWDDEE